MWWIPVAVASVIVIIITVVLIRTVRFVPSVKNEIVPSQIDFDREKTVSDLASMIRCKTVSHTYELLDDENEFLRFDELLPSIFPKIFEKCDVKKLSKRSLLIRWRGFESSSPTVFMAHYDVVDAIPATWKHPPFDGVLEDGVLWGRGTLDTKSTLNSILQAAEHLIAEGFTPKRDVYFAFGGNEEVGGYGARVIAEYFKNADIEPSLVLDEGGAVVTEAFPGVKASCAVIGIAEKGFANIEYSVTDNGGHASTPKRNGPCVRLSEACRRIEKRGFKFKVTLPTKLFTDSLGRYSTFLYRMLFSNMWLFRPVLSIYSKLTGGEVNAIFRTTTAFTQMEGSSAANVIPSQARMVSNHRIIPGETVEGTVERIKETVSGLGVNVTLLQGVEPSPISDTQSEGYSRLCESIDASFDGCAIAPYLMLACSDARNWGDVSDKVFRFSPIAMSSEDRATIHASNEKITAQQIYHATEFYIRLMKKS